MRQKLREKSVLGRSRTIIFEDYMYTYRYAWYQIYLGKIVEQEGGNRIINLMFIKTPVGRIKLHVKMAPENTGSD